MFDSGSASSTASTTSGSSSNTTWGASLVKVHFSYIHVQYDIEYVQVVRLVLDWYNASPDLDKRVADLHIEKPRVKFTEPRKGISAKIDESHVELKEEEATQRTSDRVVKKAGRRTNYLS